jgi:segregation and condensation protein B
MNDTAKIQFDLAASLEALLLVQGDVVHINRLPRLLECSDSEALSAVTTLEKRMNHRENSGITLIKTDAAIGLATSPEISERLSSIQQKALDRDIGAAGLEVLSILLYIGPSTRSKIDYIRGVNSSSTIRSLLIRKLVERVKNPNDAREYLYRPTVELLAHIGVSGRGDLPDFDNINSAILEFSKGEPVGSDDYDNE